MTTKKNSTKTKTNNPIFLNDAALVNSILINNEFLSLVLEQDAWVALHVISSQEEIDINVLLGHINYNKRKEVTLESACTVFIIAYLTKMYIPQKQRQKFQRFYEAGLERFNLNGA